MIKRLFFILILVSLANLVFGQTEKAESKKAMESFTKNYNADDFDAVYSNYSADMKDFMPIDNTVEFLGKTKVSTGQIKKTEFIRYKGNYAIYKTNFERALFSVNISVDGAGLINGLSIEPYSEVESPKMERNTTSLILPFKGEWTLVWGGDTKELNYHVENRAQKNAFDFIITDSLGKSYKTDGRTNEDYYAFGKDIIAPCDGVVVLVVDGIKDNVPGEFNTMYVPGNTVIVETKNKEYLFFAHFVQHSIVVKQGDKVKQGQLLGHCGNSGNSSEAHLHFHIQNVENMNIATGVKCFFEKITVNGVEKKDYSPLQKEKVK